MRSRYVLPVALCLGIAVVIGVAGQAAAQKAADKNAVRYDGRVTVLNKETSTLTLQVKTQAIQIKYNDQTKFTFRNKPATIDDVKEGRRVIVLIDQNQKDMVAARVDVREGK